MKNNIPEIWFQKISKENIEKISNALLSQSSEYMKYFMPFAFDSATLGAIISKVKNDIYYLVLVDHQIAGFYMLRGLDGGFKIPSFGIWVNSNFQGMGLANLIIQHSIVSCKIAGISQIMLKVDPQNVNAKYLYEKYDFKIAGIDEKNNNLIYIKNVS